MNAVAFKEGGVNMLNHDDTFGEYIRKCREQLGMYQEIVGMDAGITRKSLGLYEHDDTIPPPGVAVQLARIYGQPVIVSRYCNQCCSIGRILPKVDIVCDLPRIVMYLQSELKSAKSLVDELPDIAKYGRIPPAKLDEFRKILDGFELLHQVVEMLLLWGRLHVPTIVPKNSARPQKGKTALCEKAAG